MHRFYCPKTDFSAKTVVITDKEELHHLRNVLRLKNNNDIHLFDGKGKEAAGILLSVTAQKADVQITSVKSYHRSKPLFILACALPKKSKFEMIIEKATELGVDEIIPMMTQRTEVNLKGDRLGKKGIRFHTVALNASKQSQRMIIPTIHPVTDFKTILDHLTETTTTIIPSLPEKSNKLFAVLQRLKSPQAISFFIGPEGDFTPEEYALAQKQGCIPVTLGNTVLKVETAAICTLSCANIFFHR
jgi:16S rRNA (uracil1498-N3)-methyltransferase